MTRTIYLIMALIIAIGAGAFFLLRSGAENATAGAGAGERKISHWVAPMDPNYRRDEPGKSPMGMDLIPVYEDEAGGGGEPSLKISAAVVNNIGVKTQKVIRENLVREINTVGSIMIDEEARSDIHVRAEGWIEKLNVESVGEEVEAGEVLFEIYAPALVAAQSEFAQALKIGRPPLIRAATERLTALGMNGAQISELKRTRNVRQRIDIVAPQSGVVIALNAREGMFLRPSDRAMQLADLSNIWIIADVFETEAQWVAPGDAAQMTLPAFPGETWEGEVDYVYPTAEMMTRTIQVRLRFPNPDGRLKPNMFANVRVGAAPKENVLTIQQSAIIRTSKNDRVIVALGDGRFRPAQIKTGIESDGKVEVLAGLNEGEDIVVESQFLIDSEASLDPGLLRLSAPPVSDGEAMVMKEDPPNKNLEAEGRIVSIDVEKNTITIDHKPVPEIGWPAMTMAFMAPPEIDMNAVKIGEAVHFAFRETARGYELAAIAPMPEKEMIGDEQ